MTNETHCFLVRGNFTHLPRNDSCFNFSSPNVTVTELFDSNCTLSAFDEANAFINQLSSMRNFYIGLLLAVSSSIFIGSSFILKKKALIRLANPGLANGAAAARASAGGYGYLRDWMWWAGVILMALGEAMNFVAYAFAPATLVTPLGALSVLVTTILSSKLLKERLNLLGKIGCIVCVLGSTVVVLHSPKEEHVATMEMLGEMMKNAGFGLYVVAAIIFAGTLAVYAAPRWGTTNILVYILICSLIGSLSVLAVKGIGLAITESLGGRSQLANWQTWFWLLSLLICITIQLVYLNKALDVFNTAMVTPIYYVFFTSFVILASGILYDEFGRLGAEDIIGIIVGFSVTVIGIFQMQIFKDVNITFRQLRHLLMGKHTGSTRTKANSENYATGIDDGYLASSRQRLAGTDFDTDIVIHQHQTGSSYQNSSMGTSNSATTGSNSHVTAERRMNGGGHYGSADQWENMNV